MSSIDTENLISINADIDLPLKRVNKTLKIIQPYVGITVYMHRSMKNTQKPSTKKGNKKEQRKKLEEQIKNLLSDSLSEQGYKLKKAKKAIEKASFNIAKKLSLQTETPQPTASQDTTPAVEAPIPADTAVVESPKPKRTPAPRRKKVVTENS